VAWNAVGTQHSLSYDAPDADGIWQSENKVKAIRAHSFGGPEVPQLETVEDPVPGPGEVVVEVRAAGVNPADTYMRTGTYAIRPELPYIPGGDAGGVISAIGPGVSEHKVGDPVVVALHSASI